MVGIIHLNGINIKCRHTIHFNILKMSMRRVKSNDIRKSLKLKVPKINNF